MEGKNMSDLTATPWSDFALDAQPHDRISANFKFYELTNSETADRRGINNSFAAVEEVQAAVYLCRNVLQPVRDTHGRFSPNSVFRGQALERALKNKRRPWISTSQHTRGQACDIEIPGLSTIELSQWVIDNLEFDQVICECYNPAKGPNAGWVHVSLLPPGFGQNRRKILSYVMNAGTGKYQYVNGLRESP
jgi:hypothetical protein